MERGSQAELQRILNKRYKRKSDSTNISSKSTINNKYQKIRVSEIDASASEFVTSDNTSTKEEHSRLRTKTNQKNVNIRIRSFHPKKLNMQRTNKPKNPYINGSKKICNNVSTALNNDICGNQKTSDDNLDKKETNKSNVSVSKTVTRDKMNSVWTTVADNTNVTVSETINKKSNVTVSKTVFSSESKSTQNSVNNYTSKEVIGTCIGDDGITDDQIKQAWEEYENSEKFKKYQLK